MALINPRGDQTKILCSILFL